MKRTTILIPMRLGSTRVPRKLLLELGGQTIAERSLRTARQVADHFGFGCLAAAAEPELVQIADRLGVEVFHRSVESVTDATNGHERFAGWSARLKPRFDWVFGWNPCFTLMRWHVAAAIVWAFRGRPIRSVFCRDDALIEPFSEYGRGFREFRPSGKINKAVPYLVPTHFSTLYPVEWFDRTTPQWYPSGEYDVCVYDWSPDFLDIDTPADWELMQGYYRGTKGPLNDDCTD